MNLEIRQSPEQRKSKAWVVYGGPGHFSEYTIHLDGYDIDNYIPEEIAEEIQNMIGKEWQVLNRGTRIEVMGKESQQVEDAIEEILGQKYDITFA